MIHFKKLAHAVVGAGNFEFCRADWQPGNSEQSPNSAGEQAGNTGRVSTLQSLQISLLQAASGLCVRSDTGWMRPTHTVQSNHITYNLLVYTLITSEKYFHGNV